MILQQENELQAIQFYYILEKHLKLALLDFSTGSLLYYLVYGSGRF